MPKGPGSYKGYPKNKKMKTKIKTGKKGGKK